MSIIHDALNKIQIKRRLDKVQRPDNSVEAHKDTVKSSEQKQAAPAAAKPLPGMSGDKLSRIETALASGRAMLKNSMARRRNRLQARDRMVFLAGLLCLLGGYLLYSQLPHRTYHPSLELNGVFVSDQMRMAVINNQSYHVGDMVAEMKVIGIEHEGVKLKNDDGVMDLRVKPAVA